jgi:serine/threonine protein kinase
MADSASDVEEVVVDLAEANQLFQAYLSKGKISFIERLEKMAMDDEEMEGDESIGPAMEALSKYVLSHDPGDVLNLNLFSLTDFGLTVNAMHNVGYLVILMDKANRRRSNISKATNDSEIYDEDFESLSLENSGRSVTSDTLIIDHQPHSPPLVGSGSPEAVMPKGYQRQGGGAASGGAEARSSRLASRGKDKEWIAKGHWRMGEKIGSGAFGEVFQGLNSRNGQLFAVKRLKFHATQAAELENLANEIDLMRSLTHPNIVEYIGTKVDSANEYVYIFQEWVPGGSVASLLEKFGPFQIGVVQTYTRQILTGLKYLHDNGIIHRDIKGGNILVENSGSVKLADFGASAKMAMGETQETATIKGTPYFMAPEVLSQSKYGRKGDVWAVGCTVIQMLTGQPPWKGNNIQNIVQLHMLLSTMKEGPPKIDREVPQLVMDFLCAVFRKDPTQRPSPAALLTHPFLCAEDLDDSMGTIGPGRLSMGNRPYRDTGEDHSGGSSKDLLRLKDAHLSPPSAYEKFEQAGIKNNFSAEDTMENIDHEINLRKLGCAGGRPDSRALTAAAGSRYPASTRGGGGGGLGDSMATDDELQYSESAGDFKQQAGRPSSSERGGGVSSRERLSASLAVGARVEARFRAGKHWYPGVIARRRSRDEDSYDLDYDDGEAETHVPRYLIRMPEHGTGRNGEVVKVSPREAPSPSTNPFGRPAQGGVSPAAASNPFARQGGKGIANPFASPPQHPDDRQRSSTAVAPPRGGGGGGGAFGPPDSNTNRRNIRTADSASGKMPEKVPKSQLTSLKSSINSGINAPKRRSSKGSEDGGGGERSKGGSGSVVPVLDMKHSRSEHALPRGSSGDRGPSSAAGDGDAGYAKESPRSTEGTPRRLDPLTRRRAGSGQGGGQGSGEHSSHGGGAGAGEAERVQHRSMAPPGGPAVATSSVVAKEFLSDSTNWQCKKCSAVNEFIPDVDYCDYCSTRRGATGSRGILSEVVMRY